LYDNHFDNIVTFFFPLPLLTFIFHLFVFIIKHTYSKYDYVLLVMYRIARTRTRARVRSETSVADRVAFVSLPAHGGREQMRPPDMITLTRDPLRPLPSPESGKTCRVQRVACNPTRDKKF